MKPGTDRGKRVTVQLGKQLRRVGHTGDVLRTEQRECDRYHQKRAADHDGAGHGPLQVGQFDRELPPVGHQVGDRSQDADQHRAGEDLAEDEELDGTEDAEGRTGQHRFPMLALQRLV